MTTDTFPQLLAWAALFVLFVSGCNSSSHATSTSILRPDIGAVPNDLAADYEIFAHNCSKCHSIERPLTAPVSDNHHWELYVAKMMRTPSSGISKAEAPHILRFLFWYTDRKAGRIGATTASGERAETVAAREEAAAAVAADKAAAPSETPAAEPSVAPASAGEGHAMKNLLEKLRLDPSSAARWSCLAALVLVLLGAILLPYASGQDRNFAGSVQSSYLYVHDKNARDVALDGFVTEASLKIAVDFNDHISTNVKVCFGCHGFEVGMAYIDLTIVDEARFRVGRFSPSFGDFQLRHDPANHRTVDKPLVYDMGRMVRLREWNEGIMPAPYVDNGLEFGGTHWFGTQLQLDYAAYAVGGFRGNNDGQDIDWIQQRTPGQYYVDNNSRPSVGGRVSATLDLSDKDMTFTAGASGMGGWYDPAAKLSYMVLGADFYARIKRVEFRGEYLLRRTQMALGDDPGSRFKYGPGKNGKYDPYFLKDGFYVEAIVPVLPRFELVARFDGMRRRGNVPVNSALRKESGILRYTFGGDVSLGYGVRIKMFGEFYDFSDFKDEIVATLAVVSVL